MISLLQVLGLLQGVGYLVPGDLETWGPETWGPGDLGTWTPGDMRGGSARPTRDGKGVGAVLGVASLLFSRSAPLQYNNVYWLKIYYCLRANHIFVCYFIK